MKRLSTEWNWAKIAYDFDTAAAQAAAQAAWASYQEQVAILRDAIDEVDSQLLEVLANRMELSKRIGQMKSENNVAFYQHNRWNSVVEHAREEARKLGLNEEFVLKLFSAIHLESIDIQGE